MVAVGFAEQLEANAEALESVGSKKEIAFGSDPTQHQMWVWMAWGQEVAGGFDGRVDGLHRNLRGRKIAPHQDIQVFNLGEGGGHCWLGWRNDLPDDTLAARRCSRNSCRNISRVPAV